MKKYRSVLLILLFSSWCNQALACKVASNFKTSQKSIQTLLEAASKTGSYEGYNVTKIENKIGPESTRIELKNGQGKCKMLIFSASQPMCRIEYKFLKEKTCESKGL